MEIGDGMGTVATNKLLQVCWRRRVCISSFQWPRWSGDRHHAAPGRAAMCRSQMAHSSACRDK